MAVSPVKPCCSSTCKNSAPVELPLAPEKFVGSSRLTLPDYVVFENIVLVLTKRLRSAFNFLSHFFICAHVFSVQNQPGKIIDIIISIWIYAAPAVWRDWKGKISL
ncbi:hypothetical protein LOF13_04475 [Klebsiella pneumoniae subsp. pneumoniae]|nr:hypothetical protein LOF13_04475 [Klebsiella pneumoniae subsp. pneumoniae]